MFYVHEVAEISAQLLIPDRDERQAAPKPCTTRQRRMIRLVPCVSVGPRAIFGTYDITEYKLGDSLEELEHY
jgi:hypothetical protein